MVLCLIHNYRSAGKIIMSSLFLRAFEDIRGGLMEEVWHSSKHLLSLIGPYQHLKVLDKDPTSSTERKMNAALLGLKKNCTIPDLLYRRLKYSGGYIPLLYELPKIHKPGIPLRPIVSFVPSPTYALSLST